MSCCNSCSSNYSAKNASSAKKSQCTDGSRPFVIWDGITNIREDTCAQVKEDVESRGPGCYETRNYFRWSTTPREYANYNFEPGHYQKVYYDACSVNTDSDLRFAPMTNQKEIKQLFTEPYRTTPYMGPGQRGFCNKDLESELLQGMDDAHFNACTSTSEITIDRFQCLPQFIASVQDWNHIIYPWTRGGLGSRDLTRQVNYDKYCLNLQNTRFINQQHQTGFLG